MPSPLVKTPTRLWSNYEPAWKKARLSTSVVDEHHENRITVVRVPFSPFNRRPNLLGAPNYDLKYAHVSSFGKHWHPSWLITAVTRDISYLSASNEKAGLAHQHVDESLKMFFSQHAEAFSLRFYVTRLVTYYHCSASAFVAALVYLDRVHVRCRALALVNLNAHRLLATALVLAVKYLDDEVCINAYYARVAGLALPEFNELEKALLDILEWRLAIAPSLFARYERSLLDDAISEYGDV